MKVNKFEVTVFIPTYFGEERLEELLTQVFKQKVEFSYEVLIYDTSSSDRTPDIIRKFAAKHSNMRHKTITKAEFGHGRTRQAAAVDAKGDIVVYLSQDAIPSHDRWLYEMVKPFSLSEEVAGVVGNQYPQPKALPMLKSEIRSVFQNLGPDNGTTLYYKDNFIKNQSQYDIAAFYSDVNSAARKSVLLNKIPYKDVPYAEDQLFGRDIIDHGLMKAYASRGSVVHSNEISLRDYRLRMFDETMGLRAVGVAVEVPSYKVVTKMVIRGVLRDWLRTVTDQDYSLKRKIYWLFMNPFFHIEKWRGVRLGAKTEIDNVKEKEKYSLEEKQAKIKSR